MLVGYFRFLTYATPCTLAPTLLHLSFKFRARLFAFCVWWYVCHVPLNHSCPFTYKKYFRASRFTSFQQTLYYTLLNIVVESPISRGICNLFRLRRFPNVYIKILKWIFNVSKIICMYMAASFPVFGATSKVRLGLTYIYSRCWILYFSKNENHRSK